MIIAAELEAGQRKRAARAEQAAKAATGRPKKVQAPREWPEVLLPPHYHSVGTRDELAAMVAAVEAAGDIAFDTETTGLDVMLDTLVGCSIYAGGHAWYIPVAHVDPVTGAPLVVGQLDRSATEPALRRILENPAIKKVLHHARFDQEIVLHWAGIHIDGIRDDCLPAAHILNENEPHGLKELAKRYLGDDGVDFSQRFGKVRAQHVPILTMTDYACHDVELTWRLSEFQRKFLAMNKYSALNRVYREIELPLIASPIPQVLPPIVAMEMTGTCVDVEYLRGYGAELQVEIDGLRGQLAETFHGINVNSPLQLSKELFDVRGLPQVNGRSTAEDVLKVLVDDCAEVELLLRYRELAKLKSTYVDSLLEQLGADGRIHGRFNPSGPVTGRFSSDSPNLQNIPKRTKAGRRIRQAFVPQAGYRLLDIDYSQIELRILAHLSEDPVLVEAYRQGQDIHKATAAKVFDIALEAVTKEQRNRAKAVNFGIVYGETDYGLAKQLGCERKEARIIIRDYFEALAGVRAYLANSVLTCKKQGYVETIFGRKRRLTGIYSADHSLYSHAERQAKNHPVQGSSADITKLAISRCHYDPRLAALGARMIITVHDQIVWEVPEETAEEALIVAKALMEGVVTLRVPILAEGNILTRWGVEEDD